MVSSVSSGYVLKTRESRVWWLMPTTLDLQGLKRIISLGCIASLMPALSVRGNPEKERKGRKKRGSEDWKS